MARDDGIHVAQEEQRTSLSLAPPVCVEEPAGSCLIAPRTLRATPNICLAILMNGLRRR